MSAAKEKLDIDRKALSEAEAVLNADKHQMEKRAETARHHMQRATAKEVSCVGGGVLDAAAAAPLTEQLSYYKLPFVSLMVSILDRQHSE